MLAVLCGCAPSGSARPNASPRPTPTLVLATRTFPPRGAVVPTPSSVRLSPGRIDACALLTIDEVEAGLGTAPATHTLRDLGRYTQCVWSSGDLRRSLYVEAYQPPQDLRALYQRYLAAAHTPRSLSGIGDAAFAVHYYGVALKANVLVRVVVQEPGFPDIAADRVGAALAAAAGRA